MEIHREEQLAGRGWRLALVIGKRDQAVMKPCHGQPWMSASMVLANFADDVEGSRWK